MRFERLRTNSEEVDNLLGYLVDKAADIFADRLSAVYITGSLSYGDFVPARSDIDGFLFLDGPVSQEDCDDYRGLIASVGRMYPAYEGRVLDGPISTQILENRREIEKTLGFVNLTSLIQSGKLISGREIFISVRPPSRWELDTYMAQDVADILRRRPEKVPCAVERDQSSLAAYCEEVWPLISWLVYPARVFYTMKTGRIGSKKTAVVHYRLSHDNEYNIWLDEALRLRSEATGAIQEDQLRPLMDITVAFFWHLVNAIQARMGLVRRGEEEVYAPAEAVNRFRRLLDVA